MKRSQITLIDLFQVTINMNGFKGFIKFLFFIFLINAAFLDQGKAQFDYEHQKLVSVLEDINKKTGYAVLYREANLSQVSVTFSARSNNLIQKLTEALQNYGINVLADAREKQIVVYLDPAKSIKKSIYLSGQVVDASSGERLPFATVSWQAGGSVTGVASNEAGIFSIQRNFIGQKITLEASYVGYEPQQITVDISELNELENVTFRLQPKPAISKEVIVTGVNDFGQSVLSRRSIEINSGSILGESNTLKSLQVLPAVAQTAALSNGINVRGSSADGFQVLLDGVTIYSYTHMFGLFDNFNADALKTSGLFYDITPANYQAPSGGTLALINKTGSLNDHRVQAGISNSSVKATVEGPVSKGRSSFLISGRWSYLDQVDWLQNSDLVQWGLNVDRPREIAGSQNLTNVQVGIVNAEDNDAQFGDVHAKFYTEQRNGGRLTLSGYFGFDDVEQNSRRLFRTFNSSNGSTTEFQPVSTQNNWYNGLGSVQYQVPLRPNLYQKTTVGFTTFGTEFDKDDFTYTQINNTNGALESFSSSLRVENVLNEVLIKHEYDHRIGRFINNFGVAYRYYSGEYFEDSFLRPNFFVEDDAQKIDAFFQTEFSLGQIANINTGVRGHYYSSGEYLDWSPRVKVKFIDDKPVSFGAGYSRNFQHVNRVSFSNVLTSDVWILVDEDQPPAETEQFTAGLYFGSGQHFGLQVEGYLKDFNFLRLHEIDTFSSATAFSSSPWFAGNSAEAKGVEISVFSSIGFLELNQGLSVSEMEIQNDNINNGEPFLADWDRTYQYTASAKVDITRSLGVFANFIYASGTPDKLAIFGNKRENRLGDYFRTDLRASYKKDFGKSTLIASFSVYNILDRDNPWYRELAFVLDQSGSVDRFEAVPTDVYDLGFQPSFSLNISF